MSTYSVHIIEMGSFAEQCYSYLGGPFAVYVRRHHKPSDADSGAPTISQTVSATSYIATRERAESIARDYRAQFGVGEST